MNDMHVVGWLKTYIDFVDSHILLDAIYLLLALSPMFLCWLKAKPLKTVDSNPPS